MMMPPERFNLPSLLQTQTRSRTAVAVATAVSSTNLLSNTTGLISAEVPATNKILKTLLPTILPIAISALPLLAAAIDVTSSGNEVPKATIVRPMILFADTDHLCDLGCSIDYKITSKHDTYKAGQDHQKLHRQAFLLFIRLIILPTFLCHPEQIAQIDQKSGSTKCRLPLLLPFLLCNPKHQIKR